MGSGWAHISLSNRGWFWRVVIGIGFVAIFREDYGRKDEQHPTLKRLGLKVRGYDDVIFFIYNEIIFVILPINFKKVIV